MEKSTTELLGILNAMDPDRMDAYIREYGRNAGNHAIFSESLAGQDITTADIVRGCRGMISKSYIYDILAGVKTNPSRDILLTLCIAAEMDRKMTRRVLENYGQRDLYAKDTRDIIIATYINNRIFDLDQINEELFRYGLKTLNEVQ